MSVETELRGCLEAKFQPELLELTNESHQHSVPANSETHFKVVMVSDRFKGLRRVARHQAVYAEVQSLLEGPVHALAMHLYDSQEWQDRNAPAPSSPQCLGGSKAESDAA